MLFSTFFLQILVDSTKIFKNLQEIGQNSCRFFKHLHKTTSFLQLSSLLPLCQTSFLFIASHRGGDGDGGVQIERQFLCGLESAHVRDVGTRHAESAYALLSDTACRVPTMLSLPASVPFPFVTVRPETLLSPSSALMSRFAGWVGILFQ